MIICICGHTAGCHVMTIQDATQLVPGGCRFCPCFKFRPSPESSELEQFDHECKEKIKLYNLPNITDKVQ